MCPGPRCPRLGPDNRCWHTQPADVHLGCVDQVWGLPRRMPAACFMCRGGGVCSSASPGRALRGQENSFWCSRGWTVLSVQSLGLCQRAGRRALSGSCLGKQLVPSPSRAAPHGAGAAAVDAGALPVGQPLPEGRGLDRRREPSPRAYSHQQEPICALRHCPGIRPALDFLRS